MEAETQTRKHKNTRYKHHQDMSDDPQIKAITTIHKDQDKHLPALERIDEDLMLKIIERYGKDTKLDLYTIGEAFGVGATALNKTLKSDKFKDAYQVAKLKRGEVLAQEGYEAACAPYDKIQKGEEVSMVEVGAAKLKANYCLAYGRSINPELNPQKDTGHDGGGINVVVNTGIALKI